MLRYQLGYQEQNQTTEHPTRQSRNQERRSERRLEEFDFARPREVARLERQERLEKPLQVLCVSVALGVLATDVWIGAAYFLGSIDMRTAHLLMYGAAALAVGLWFLGVSIIKYFSATAERRFRLQEEHRDLLRRSESHARK